MKDNKIKLMGLMQTLALLCLHMFEHEDINVGWDQAEGTADAQINLTH